MNLHNMIRAIFAAGTLQMIDKIETVLEELYEEEAVYGSRVYLPEIEKKISDFEERWWRELEASASFNIAAVA